MKNEKKEEKNSSYLIFFNVFIHGNREIRSVCGNILGRIMSI